METSQGVDTAVEKEEETQAVENGKNGDENMLNNNLESNVIDPTSLVLEGGGNIMSTIHLPRRRKSMCLSPPPCVKRDYSEQNQDSVFTFDSYSFDQASSMESRPSDALRPRSLSIHNIRSPHEKKKPPSSPVHNRLRPTKSFFQDINPSGKPSYRERSSFFSSLQLSSSDYIAGRSISSELYSSLEKSIPEDGADHNNLSSSVSEISSSSVQPGLPPPLDIHLRSSNSETNYPSIATSLKSLKLRRNRPSLNASWILPRTKAIRNTWSSRSDAVLPITFASPDSPCSSPLQRSEHSVDIVIKPSPCYFRRKQRRYSINSSFFPHQSIFDKESSPTESTTSSSQPSPNQSISPFDTESYRSSWLNESPMLPFSSTSRLLSVSYDLSEEELQLPKDAFCKTVIPSNQKRFSILPSPDSSDYTISLCESLMDTGDELSSLGTYPKDSCEKELDGIDFSDFQRLSTQTPTPQSQENTEEMIETFDDLMKADNEKNQKVAWDGEELEGGEVSSDENMIDSGLLDSPKPATPPAEQPSVSLPVSPYSPEPESSSDEEEVEPVNSAITREPSPMPNSSSSSPHCSPVPVSDETSLYHHHIIKEDVMSLEFDKIISYVKELNIESSSLSPLPLPPPPTPITSDPSPLLSPTTVSPDISPATPVSIPEMVFPPTNQQLDHVIEVDKEYQRKLKEKEKEEEQLREQQLQKAEQSLHQWKEQHQIQVQEELRKRDEEKSVDYRISEFTYLFGDCSPLLLPYILILDNIFGPVLQPQDDLHHLDQCYQRYIEEGVLDHTSFYERIQKQNPDLDVRKCMIQEVDSNRYLQSLFTSFSFYYQCALNYSYMKLRNFV